MFQKVDKTFELRSDQRYTAVNADGFEVDVARRAAKDGNPHPLRVSRYEMKRIFGQFKFQQAIPRWMVGSLCRLL